ncbi:hypothetical protein SAMN04487970_100531 [Paenibacillus tianmuensis]|uniref:Fur-regulated basic protein A n=1 Tax=Paenibacillus tianmuensis TaxID=624147 RepID=A0A1G4Q1U3_9BACL|nr:hypothetical protein [Paenibacillus tianmuensis]SCW38594.1 hypothetical protein SAMN04487970_100531 [Paenibacillus tianmuensis]
MLFSNRQKKLILDVLLKERRRLFSKHKGELLDKTIEDLSQMLRNEELNAEPKDNVIDWDRKGGKRR